MSLKTAVVSLAIGISAVTFADGRGQGGNGSKAHVLLDKKSILYAGTGKGGGGNIIEEKRIIKIHFCSIKGLDLTKG